MRSSSHRHQRPAAAPAVPAAAEEGELLGEELSLFFFSLRPPSRRACAPRRGPRAGPSPAARPAPPRLRAGPPRRPRCSRRASPWPRRRARSRASARPRKRPRRSCFRRRNSCHAPPPLPLPLLSPPLLSVAYSPTARTLSLSPQRPPSEARCASRPGRPGGERRLEPGELLPRGEHRGHVGRERVEPALADVGGDAPLARGGELGTAAAAAASAARSLLRGMVRRAERAPPGDAPLRRARGRRRRAPGEDGEEVGARWSNDDDDDVVDDDDDDACLWRVLPPLKLLMPMPACERQDATKNFIL